MFWCWLVGFWLVFLPFYLLGLAGVTRRVQHFDDPSLQPYFFVSVVGVLTIAAGIGCFVIQIAVSIWKRDELRDLTGDPWNGRSLEWATTSPPPPYNFAFTPIIHDVDAYWDMKQRHVRPPTTSFRPIHMPKDTAAGMVIAFFATVLGFALIWYIWWLVVASFAAAVVSVIAHTFNYDRDYYVPADEVARIERGHAQAPAE